MLDFSAQAEIDVDLIAPEGNKLPGVKLPVAGTMQPEIRVLPARVFLGSHPMDQTASAVLVMQVPDGALARLERVEIDSEDLSVRPTEVIGIGSGRAFQITQRIRQLGDHATTATFFVAKGNQRAMPVKVEIVFRGEPKDWSGREFSEGKP